MKKLTFIFSLALMLLLSSCGNSSSFNIEGEIDGGGNQNMRVVYIDNGATNLLSIKVVDGKFEFKATASAPTMLEFYTANKTLLGRAYVEPGDNLECVFYKNSPYKAKIKGNEVSERWSTFLNNNIQTIAGGDIEKINALVSKYINENKTDIVSTLLLLTEYINPENESKSTLLLSSIAPEARPSSLIESFETMLERVNNIKANERISMTSYYCSNDTLATFVPHNSSYAVITFSNKDTRNDGEIADSMRMFRKKYHKKRLQLIDISFDTDTASWKKSIENDSATWQQGWVVGAASASSIERLGISRLPFFIMADSTGKQIYRGNSIEKISQEIKKCIKPQATKE